MTMKTTITFLGHTCFLIEHGEDRVVFDPVLRKKILLWNRRDTPVFVPETLSQTGTVVITNPRFSRFDHHSLKFFKQATTTVLCPEDLHGFLKKFFHFSLKSHHDASPVQAGSITLEAISVKHTSWRLFKAHGESWHHLIKTPELTVFYGSDMTFNHDFFTRVGSQNSIDVAILPIGFFGLPFTNKKQFLSPEEAARAVRDLNAARVIPCHFDSFTGMSKQENVLERFKNEVESLGLSARLQILGPGESLTPTKPSKQTITNLNEYRPSDVRRKTSDESP